MIGSRRGSVVLGEDGALGASACLGNDEALRYVANELDARETEQVADHLDGCATCRRVVAQLAKTSLLDVESVEAPAVVGPGDPIPQGSRVGRYVVQGELGAGAMGVVYRARDPELRRDVAIKVVRSQAVDRSSVHARFLREARSLARLSHPNVVPVYDVGEDAGRVFIAMELIKGTTLRGWLDAKQRHPRAILEVLRAAAAGLAGAHRAGMVHRDFKPDNVLIADDGRVLVSDFGLVAFRGDEPDTPSSMNAAHNRLSATGALIGTPAYMAPEQLRGASVQPPADVFAWCVTAFEALAGRRPFVGDTPNLRLREIEAGRIDPRIRRLPRRLRAALRRGLSPDPRRRFATVDDLVAATRPARGRAAVLLAVAGTLAVGATALVADATDEDSTLAHSRLESPTRSNTAAVLLKEAAAADEEGRSGEAIDAFARAYAAAVSEGDWASATDAAVRSVDVYVMTMTDDAQATRWLGHAEAALSRVGPDPQREERLAYTTANFHAGRGDLAKAEAAQAIVLEKRIAIFGEVDTRVADTWATLGGIELRRGKLQRGLESHRRALLAMPAEAADWVRGKTLMSYGAGLLDAGEVPTAYERLLEARELVQDEGPAFRGRAAHNLAIAELMLGKLDDAAAHFAEAKEDVLTAYGPDHPGFATLLLGTSNLQTLRGDFDASHAGLEQALNIVERNAGLTHPDLMVILADLAWTSHVRGDSGTAERHLARAVDIALASQDPTDARVARMQEKLAFYRVASGKLEEANGLVDDARRRRRFTVGPDDPSLSLNLTARARVRLAQGGRAEAEEAAARALELANTPGDRAEALLLQAELIWQRGQRRRAVRTARRARTEIDGRIEDANVDVDIERWLDDHGQAG